MRKVTLTALALLLSGTMIARAAEQPVPNGKDLKGPPASSKLRKRIDLYLRALKATPAELKEYRAQDAANGIQLMERNPFLRARLELVALISQRERTALLDGGTYVSDPYGKLPKPVRSLMDSALGMGQVEMGERETLRYSLRVCISDGAEQLMINQIDASGRIRSGGSVLPGVKAPDPEGRSLN